MKINKMFLAMILVIGRCVAAEPYDVVTRAMSYPSNLQQVFAQTITPTDLTCYPYIIEKPGTYVLTKDFVHVAQAAKDGQPLIKVLSDDVKIDLQTFSLYQLKDQIDGTSTEYTSNLIEIGSDLVEVNNVWVVNGALNNAAGCAIKTYPGSHLIRIDNVKISNCAGAGIFVQGNDTVQLSHCEISRSGVPAVADLLVPKYIADDVTYGLDEKTVLGGCGIVAVKVNGLFLDDVVITANGKATSAFDSAGLYVQDCIDVIVHNSLMNLQRSGQQAYGLYARRVTGLQIDQLSCDSNNGVTYGYGCVLHSCAQGKIQSSVITNNSGAGVYGVYMLESNTIAMNHVTIAHNIATGAFLTSPTILDSVTSGAQIPFYVRNRLDNSWTLKGNADIQAAYQAYKARVAMEADQRTCDDWVAMMDSMHAIDYALAYYTSGSHAYGLALYNSSHITAQDVHIMTTQSDHNSAWGLFVDQGIGNVFAQGSIVGTKAFAAETSVVEDITVAVYEKLFGDIFDDQTLHDDEITSMVGRGVGIEIRNNAESVYVHNTEIKNNGSSEVFGAGIFLNRSMRASIVQNRLENNCGKDLGYGILNRQVDPTDVISGITFYANGTVDDKNISHGGYWSISGKFSVKHVYPGDLDLANNIGPYENLQILFDPITIPSLAYTVPDTDITSDYLA